MSINVKLIHDNAAIPVRMTLGSAGYDILSPISTSIERCTQSLIKTGIVLEIPVGYVGMIRDRSSLALKGINIEAGIIDSDYRDEIGILVHVTDLYKGDKFVIDVGDSIAQILIVSVLMTEMTLVDNVSHTDRGKGGFGSTNSKI